MTETGPLECSVTLSLASGVPGAPNRGSKVRWEQGMVEAMEAGICVFFRSCLGNRVSIMPGMSHVV